jgi:hypothetical protein
LTPVAFPASPRSSFTIPLGFLAGRDAGLVGHRLDETRKRRENAADEERPNPKARPMTLSAEQIADLKRGLLVRVSSEEVGEEVIVVRASTFAEMTDSLDDDAEKRAWAKLGAEAAARWAKDNAY